MKLFLIDAYALIYRSYYAFIKNPRINSKGLNTSAMFGFVNTLEELIKKENPSHIGIAFDPSGKTFRHEAYDLYKANREQTPEDIKIAIPYIKKIIAAYNIKTVEVPKYEADDVIGTIAKKAEKENIEVYMLTPDKDYAQLTSDKIFMYRPKIGFAPLEILDEEGVKKKYDIERAEQIIDYLALVGDTADNIPGCPGVGEKTAIKLLKEWDNVENIIANTENIKGKLGINIKENKEKIEFSKFLATIETNVPIGFEATEFLKKEINENELNDIFEELEFKTLSKRVIKNTPTQLSLFDDNTLNEDEEIKSEWKNSLKNIDDIKPIYTLIQDKVEVDNLANKLINYNKISIDTETTNIDPIEANLVGISISVEKHKAYYISLFPKDKNKTLEMLKSLIPILESDKIEKIGHNIKYDKIVFKNYAIELKGKIFDTMIAHYLINPEVRHNMDYAASTLLNYETIPIDRLIGTGKNQKNMADLKPEEILNYAAEDADITLQLYEVLAPQIKKENIQDLLDNIELPLVNVLCDMEYKGVKLDTDTLKQSADILNEKAIILEKDIIELAGTELNINSPKQIGEILFEKLNIVDKPKKTKTGQYVTSEEILVSLKDKHPIINKILEYRGTKKLLSTYIEALPLLISKKDNRIHTSYNQTVTATGRLSSSNPNLQNIPIRDDEGKEIRRAFTVEKGNKFFSADYSQIELRIMAHLSEDENMIEAFNSGHDIHTATAAKIYKIAIEDVTSSMRNKAKTANFGIIYGISIFGLSQRLDIPRGEAKELIDGYFETYPKVKLYMDKSIEKAKQLTYTETLFGRKRYLPDINSNNAVVRGYAERNAINAPIQGTAADIIKLAMNNIHNQLEVKQLNTKMILQVHDELNFEVPENELEIIEKLVINEMENVTKLLVPLKVDFGIGENWLEAH